MNVDRAMLSPKQTVVGGGTSVDTVVIVSGEGGWCLHL